MSIVNVFNEARLKALFDLARQEDLGMEGDLTSMLLPPTAFTETGEWQLVARETGRFCGAEILPMLIESLAPKIKIDAIRADADRSSVAPGVEIARFSGLSCQMLAAERTILNFLQHLSGVATMTAAFVEAVAGTHTKIFDTRKTLPGFRELDKYAVRCGGGHNHRIGLYDAVLIKDNHLAGIPTNRLAHTLMEMLNGIERLPSEPAFVEVECDSLEQLAQVIKVVGIDVILLDNFDPAAMREAVAMRDEGGLKGKVELEASGCVTLDNVREVAQTGVERIAVGALTHSAPSLDLALDSM